MDRVSEPRLVKNLYFTAEESLELLTLLPLLPKIRAVSYHVRCYSAGTEGSEHVRRMHGSYALPTERHPQASKHEAHASTVSKLTADF